MDTETLLPFDQFVLIPATMAVLHYMASALSHRDNWFLLEDGMEVNAKSFKDEQGVFLSKFNKSIGLV